MLLLILLLPTGPFQGHPFYISCSFVLALLSCRRMRSSSMYVVVNNFISDQFTKLLNNSRRRWLTFLQLLKNNSPFRIILVHINNTLRKIGLPANVIERQGPLTLNLTELLKQQRQLVLCGNRQLSNGQLANPIH